MKFDDTEEFAFTNGLRSRTLDTVTLLRDENPQEWYCNTNLHIIIVRYQAGMLGMGVGESEYEAINEARVVGMAWKEYEAAARGEEHENKIKFNDVKEFMMWKFDDYIICDGL